MICFTKGETGLTGWYNNGFIGPTCIVMSRKKQSIVNGAYGVRRGRNQGQSWLLQRHLDHWNFCVVFREIQRQVRELLVITDHFSRYTVAIPTRNQLASTTAKVLYENSICHYSLPARIHSDQGRNFERSVQDSRYSQEPNYSLPPYGEWAS